MAARLWWTVAAHINRARVSDELQFGSRKRFRKHRDGADDNRRGRGRNRNRQDGADGRPFVFVDMSNGTRVVMVMDGRTVPMIPVVRVVRHGMNVKRERLDLQRAQGQYDEDRQAASHSPSLCHAPAPVNAPRVSSQL